MVIEAVFECMQIKKELFEKLQLILKKDCIVGSNTSSLDIDELANSIKPFNFIGIHFFNPPHVIKTIEIVYGKTTKGISVKAAFEISNKMKKFAVLVQSCPGFLFNRLLFVYTRIVFELINIYGFYPFKIDEIFKKFGLLMGPLTMCDMNGLDVLAKVSNEQNIKMNELEKYLVNKGDFGRKTGRGYYIYDNEGKKHRNFDVEDKIRIVKSKNPEDIGLLSDEDIIHFVFFPYINEAYKCLEEGIVECPSHIDLMKIFGLGWPIKYGGPMKWATDFVGLTNIVNKLDSWFMKIIPIALSGYAIYQYYDTISVNPRKGFESRNTILSNDRLAFLNLELKTASISDILIHKIKEAKRIKRVINVKGSTEENKWDLSNSNEWDLKYSHEIVNSTGMNDDSTPAPDVDTFTVNYDDYGTFRGSTVDDIKNPCFQYLALGSQIPYSSIDMFMKVIFEVSSFDDLFTPTTFKRLCTLDKIINDLVEKYKSSGGNGYNYPKPSLPYSFNLPFYTFCINMNATGNNEDICDQIRPEDIIQLKNEIKGCFKDKSNSICRTPVAVQLDNYIIDKNYENIIGNEDKYKLKVASIVPLFFSSPKEYYEFGEDLLDSLETFYNGEDGVTIKGVNILSKDFFFQMYLFKDLYLGIFGFVLIVLIIYIYTQSIIFTSMVLLDLLLSLGISFFIYTQVLGITFFPFINFLVIILVAAVGSDDTFVLNFAYKTAVKKLTKHDSIDTFRPMPYETKSNICCFKLNKKMIIGKKVLTHDEQHEICKGAIKLAFKHSTISMFVTSATTAIAFFANTTSSIIVVKCFGVFAGLTIMVNFFFVISTLPTIIIIINKYKYDDKTKKTILKYITERLQKFKVTEKIYNFFIQIRFGVLIFFILSLLFSIISITAYPGIRLPKNNPLQILRSSHSFEWFDEYSKDYFSFENSSTLMQQFNVLFGIKPTTDASSYLVSDIGTLQVDENFNINTFNKIYQLRDIVHYFNNSDIRYKNSLGGKTLWIDSYIKHINSRNCSFVTLTCCKSIGASMNELTNFNKCSLEFSQKRRGVKFPQDMFSTVFDDGPIFDKQSLKLLAYYIVGSTNYKVSVQHKEMVKLFKQMEEMQYPHKKNFSRPIIMSSPEITKVFDLLNILSSDILTSIFFSIVISIIVIGCITRKAMLTFITLICILNVIISTIATVLWMDWKINVLETTIIVLTIGLSFDYTLHSAVAYKEIDDVICHSALEKILSMTSHVLEPILCASITNIFVGTAIIWSKTQAFYEIGVFMIIMSGYSLLSSLILFPILMICFGDRVCSSISKLIGCKSHHI
uniref:SSD domain-containing protein n=1 Tax=Parastrongyloides trichosuri TaxID=131310 RepID=A0A0N4ZKK0_PARTI